MGSRNQSPKSNPPVRDRVFCSGFAGERKGEVRLQVAAHCKRTIECLELQSYTEQGEPDKEDAGSGLFGVPRTTCPRWSRDWHSPVLIAPWVIWFIRESRAPMPILSLVLRLAADREWRRMLHPRRLVP